MSKSAEERIEELKNQMVQQSKDADELRNNYDSLYRHAEEVQRNAAYYQGQVEAAKAAPPSQSVDSIPEMSEDFDFTDRGSVQKLIQSTIESQYGQRLQQAEKYATDALQQTAGREIDSALRDFRSAHPETDGIMDFERLVLMDASDEIRRMNDAGRPVEDIKVVAMGAAKNRLKSFNHFNSEVTKRNKDRREKARSKATIPEVFSAAGFNESPKAPETTEEAGKLLDQLLAAGPTGR